MPLPELYALLDHYFRNEQWLQTKPDGWTEGGEMPGIRSGMLLTTEGQGGRWIAHSLVQNQIARGRRLSFVYDFVNGTADISSLQFTLDAARSPLRTDLDDDDFEALYGISRRLFFKLAAPRKVWQHDVFADIYG